MYQEDYFDPAEWEELPTSRAVVHLQLEPADIGWDAQAPGISSDGAPPAPVPRRGVASLATAMFALAVVAGGIATAIWGLGAAAGVTLAAGGPVVVLALLAAGWRGAGRTANDPAVLGRRQRRGRAGEDDAKR